MMPIRQQMHVPIRQKPNTKHANRAGGAWPPSPPTRLDGLSFESHALSTPSLPILEEDASVAPSAGIELPRALSAGAKHL